MADSRTSHRISTWPPERTGKIMFDSLIYRCLLIIRPPPNRAFKLSVAHHLVRKAGTLHDRIILRESLRVSQTQVQPPASMIGLLSSQHYRFRPSSGSPLIDILSSSDLLMIILSFSKVFVKGERGHPRAAPHVDRKPSLMFSSKP